MTHFVHHPWHIPQKGRERTFFHGIQQHPPTFIHVTKMRYGEGQRTRFSKRCGAGRRYQVTGTRPENVIGFRISEELDSFAIENPSSPWAEVRLILPCRFRILAISLAPLDKTNDRCAPIKRCSVLDLSPRNGAPRRGQCLLRGCSSTGPRTTTICVFQPAKLELRRCVSRYSAKRGYVFPSCLPFIL